MEGGGRMYDIRLETFLQVADKGSFNKAAEDLHITPPAVIKQINLLESELDMKLFVRTHRGLVLTEAGKSIYRDAKYIIQYCKDSLQRARKSMDTSEAIIRIGTSFMTPSQFLVSLWPQIYEKDPELKFRLVPYENTLENAREILANLGKNIDVVAGIFDEQMLQVRGCAGTELYREPFCLMVSVHHRLAAKERLTIQDLYGEELLIIRKGWMNEVDRLRQDLQNNHPDIRLVGFPFYDVNIFNQCENSNQVLLAVGKWEQVHPLMRIIPVDWDYEVPFGLLHASEPSPQVRRLLDAIHSGVLAEGR